MAILVELPRMSKVMPPIFPNFFYLDRPILPDMKRRNFIQLSTIAGAVPFVGLQACTTEIKESAKSKPKDKPEEPFRLEEWTVNKLRKAMENGELSSKEICELYLERIKAKDQSEDGLNSVIEVNPDALKIAEKLDNERAEGKIRGPLHGIPVMIKDNIDTADNMQTTAGSLALKGPAPKQDAFIVNQLREAGMVLLGKTNLSEWANFRSTRSSSGWSGRGGQTHNPWALDRNPCGSSSGSGAAVSANMCALTIGTETNGSVVCPSSANGVVGIKPTVGLWSRSGIIPISETQDTAGPMARTVADAAALLGPLTGLDSRDSRTKESQGKGHRDYTKFLDKNALSGKRIGLLKDTLGQHERVDEVIEKAIETIEKAGAEVIKDIDVTQGREYGNTGFDVLLYEFKDGVNKYLATRDGLKVKTLEEVIAFNKENADKEMPYFQQEILEMAREKGGLEDQEYQDALSKMLDIARGGIDKAISDNKLDAIMGVTGGPAWPIDLINGDHFAISSSTPAARSGYPNITIPGGFVYGLPVGINFFGQAYDESNLIAIAYAFEQKHRARKVPQLKPSLDLA